MDKKYYEAPSVEVVDLKLQGSLLAGSGGEDDDSEETEGTTIEDAQKNNFNDSWK